MASNSFNAKTQDQVYLPIDLEDDLLRPINVNRTNPNLRNPFVVEHNIRLVKMKSDQSVDDSIVADNL